MCLLFFGTVAAAAVGGEVEWEGTLGETTGNSLDVNFTLEGGFLFSSQENLTVDLESSYSSFVSSLTRIEEEIIA